jgi:hypothetical protein
MLSELTSFKVIFEVAGYKAVPVNHSKILSNWIQDVKQKEKILDGIVLYEASSPAEASIPNFSSTVEICPRR